MVGIGAVSSVPALDDAAAGVGLSHVFQPIVSLTDRMTVGYEALARWPHLQGFSTADVFAHAGAVGVLDDLDRLCIDSAVAAAMRSPLNRGAIVSVNSEPSTPYCGRENNSILQAGVDELALMFEITERSVLAHPQSLLRKVDALRSDGFAIALDDVGAQPDSLSLLDVIHPDVIKLDLALVQRQPTSAAQARTVDAVLAHHERTGALILAEGIETERHLEQAQAVGATLGQGFMFGRPGPLDHDVMTSWSLPMWTNPPRARIQSPFDLVAGTSPVRTARKQTLLALSRHIEHQAMTAADPPLVFTALQSGEYFSGITRRLYHALAETSPLVAVFGERMPAELGAGVRGVALRRGDPLCAEWVVVVLGPHTATALIAREHDADTHAPTDLDRRFDYVITFDREIVTAAVRDLLYRMT